MPDAPAFSRTDSPIADTLLALAPLRLRNHRQTRYVADDQCAGLDRMTDRDQTLMRSLYRRLSELLYTIADPSTTDAHKWGEVRNWLGRHDLDLFIDEVRELGVASQALEPSEMLAKAMHDVRGGALSSLLGRLQLFDALRATPGTLNTLFVQTRDHLKIMRNAVVGLDEPRRQADRTPKAHAMQLMLDKWHESAVGPRWRERPIRLDIDCRYAGPLTECCLESAAIDRIFYNLTGNAARHADDARMEMVVFPIPDPSGDCLRFVLSNRVSEADADRLRVMTQAGADSTHLGLGRSRFALFEPGVSSSGSGFGLTVVADFVAGAFGLRDRAEALHERYVGAILDDDERMFRVWFHWPVADGRLPAKLDDYRHPEQSLSEP